MSRGWKLVLTNSLIFHNKKLVDLKKPKMPTEIMILSHSQKRRIYFVVSFLICKAKNQSSTDVATSKMKNAPLDL